MQSRQLCNLPTDCDGPGKDNIKALTIVLCTKKVVSNRQFILLLGPVDFAVRKFYLVLDGLGDRGRGVGEMIEEIQNMEVLEEMKIMIVSIKLNNNFLWAISENDFWVSTSATAWR